MGIKQPGEVVCVCGWVCVRARVPVCILYMYVLAVQSIKQMQLVKVKERIALNSDLRHNNSIHIVMELCSWVLSEECLFAC